jgi:sirohydrochlorin cobaltochelatase
MKSIVLFGHGSRDPAWRQPIEAVAERLRVSAPDIPVRCAYLELTTPDLPATVAELAALGVRSVRVVPMFLGVGRHAREDLPRIVAELKLSHTGIDFDLSPAVGEDPRLLDLLAHISLG